MENVYDRIYHIGYMSIAAFGVIAGVGIAMAAAYNIDIPVKFGVNRVIEFGNLGRGAEEIRLSFDIVSDFAPFVHVNTRLFYAYIEAEYKVEGSETKSILWDRLVTRESPTISAIDTEANNTLRLINVPMGGKTIDLHFKIQQVPFVGFFRTKDLGTIQYTLPSQHTETNKKVE